MDITYYNTLSDEELRVIVKNGVRWYRSIARAELTRRKQERELRGKLNQVELEALGAYPDGEDYDSNVESYNYSMQE